VKSEIDMIYEGLLVHNYFYDDSQMGTPFFTETKAALEELHKKGLIRYEWDFDGRRLWVKIYAKTAREIANNA